MSESTYCEQLAHRIMKTPRVKKAIAGGDRSTIWNSACIEFDKIKSRWVLPTNACLQIIISYKPVDDDYRLIYRPPSFYAGFREEGDDGLAQCVESIAWHCLGWTVLDLSDTH